MVLLGSGVTIEQTPPPPRMEDVRRELDAAVLQAKKHYIRKARERNTGEDTPVKRYMYAVTVMRNDRFFSLHSGRRSRSLTRVYVEEREQRSRSTVPALPRKNAFVEEDNEDGSLRLEWHETIEGRKADVVEDDVTTTGELTQNLPYEYREWEHEVIVQEPAESTTVWRVGDHLFSYEEPFDLSVKLPDQVHYFFTGEHLPEKRRLYTSLPNLSTVGLAESAAFDHSAHSFYGHGFRQVGTTFLSRTMESLNDDRMNIGTRPAIHEIRGEPPPQRYFPLRACLSPSRGVRSPPPSYEEWRRSPSPGYSRYTSCYTSGLDIIGRNPDRPVPIRSEPPQPRPRTIVQRELGEEFETNLNNFWQQQKNNRERTVHTSDRHRQDFTSVGASSGISSWAPSVPPLSEDVRNYSFGVVDSSNRDARFTGNRVPKTEVDDFSRAKMTHSAPGTSIQNENARRKAVLQNRTRFRRKDTPYYSDTFFSSLEDELDAENVRYANTIENKMAEPTSPAQKLYTVENPTRYTSTKEIFVEDVSKTFPVFRADYEELNTFSAVSGRQAEGIAPPQRTTFDPKSTVEERRKFQETKEKFHTEALTSSREGNYFVGTRQPQEPQMQRQAEEHYTLVSASGSSPQAIVEQEFVEAQRPLPPPTIVQEETKWDVENEPPPRNYVTSPESEEVTNINFPLTPDNGPSVKKFKTVETEEVVEEVYEEWEIVSGLKTKPFEVKEINQGFEEDEVHRLHLGTDGVWRRHDAPPTDDTHVSRKREHDSDIPLGSPRGSAIQDMPFVTTEKSSRISEVTSPRRHRQSPFDFSKFKQESTKTATSDELLRSLKTTSESTVVQSREATDWSRQGTLQEEVTTKSTTGDMKLSGWNSVNWDDKGYPKFKGRMYTVAEVLKRKELPYSVPPLRYVPVPEYPERLRSSQQEVPHTENYAPRRKMSGNALGDSVHWFAPGEQGTIPIEAQTIDDLAKFKRSDDRSKFFDLTIPLQLSRNDYLKNVTEKLTFSEMKTVPFPALRRNIPQYSDSSTNTTSVIKESVSKEESGRREYLTTSSRLASQKNNLSDQPEYPKRTERVAKLTETLHPVEMEQKELGMKRRDFPPYPDRRKEAKKSPQLPKESDFETSSHSDQKEYVSKTTAERFPVPKWTIQHDLWGTEGYPRISDRKVEDVSETLKSAEMKHQTLSIETTKRAPPYSGSSRTAEALTSAQKERILPVSDNHPGYLVKKSKTDKDQTLKFQANRSLWDKHGYPMRTERIADVNEILTSTSELEGIRLLLQGEPKLTSSLETESEDEAIRRYQEKPQRESQALNMMIGFGDLDEPRKMKWDSRGYPAFEIAQEIHETIAPRELEYSTLHKRKQEIPAYPGKNEFDPSTGIRVVHRGLTEGMEKLHTKEAMKTASHKPLVGHHKRQAPEPPKTDAEDEYAVILPKNQRDKLRDMWDFRGYPKSTQRLQETRETLKHSELEESPFHCLRNTPIPAYPSRYSSYDRLLETPSMVQSKLTKTTKAPPIPEHYKKPPPPYEPERPPRHSEEVRTTEAMKTRDFIPDEPAGLAPPSHTHIRTDSDMARRDFNAVFHEDDDLSDDESSEKKISNSDVEEMERMLMSGRPVERKRSLDDWEIVDNSVKTAIRPQKEDYRNPSTTTVKSFDMEEPSLGGRRSNTDPELPAVSQGSESRKDYGKGLQDFAKGRQKQKSLFGLFSKKKQESVDDQFIEEVPYQIQMEAQDRPDLYRTQPQSSSHQHHGFLFGVKEKIWKRGSRDDGKQVGHAFGFRRSQSHDETVYEEQTRHVHFLEEPKRKRSSSVHVLEGTKKGIVKAKDYVLELTHKGRGDSRDVHRKPSVEVIGYEPGVRELPVDVPIQLTKRDEIEVLASSRSESEPRTGGRFQHFVPKWSRPRRTSNSSEDPDDIRNILPRVIQEKNDTIERIEHTATHNVESSYTSASTVEVGSGVQDSTYHAVPVHVTENEPVFATSSESDLYVDRSVHQTEEVLQKATEISDHYNPYYQEASTVSADYYAEPPSPEHNQPNESMIVEPPSPELQRSAEKFAADFTEKLAIVEDVLREADVLIKNQESYEKIYDHVYEDRIYDEVPAERFKSVPPPVPVSPIPKPREELHYAAVAIATEDNRYKDDEHIYEEIGDGHVVETSPYATADVGNDNHVVESSAYAQTNLYNAYETPSSLIITREEPIYSEVPKEDVFTKVVHKVEHSISHLKQKFESHSEESHYRKIDAPKRKDFIYDENSNAQIEDQQLIRTPEITETTSTRVVNREVKPYVGSPTFNKLQKKFFPEDLAERQALRDSEEFDVSVLNSPTTIVTNNGVTETEYRAYDKNQYEDTSATLVMKSPVDVHTARTTLAIRRMSRNNQWSEDESESPRLTTSHFDYNAPASPAKISPLPSPRTGSVSPRYDRSPSSPRPESPKIESRVTPPVRPTELHISLDHQKRVSPVDRVVSTEEKAPHSPEILYQSGYVKEKRKLFENGGVQNQQSHAPVVKLRSTVARTSATVVKTAEIQAPAKVHVAVSSPAEVELKRVTVGQIGVAPPKQQEEGTKRKSVLEMRREYEASMQQSQVSSTTSSPHRSRANSRRRTGEIEIGTGASLSKYSEEQSSAARRTVHRTLDKHMKEESVSVPVGQGVQDSIERRVEPTVSTSSIGHGATVKAATITVASSSSSSSVTIGAGSVPSRNTPVSSYSSIGQGAVPTSAPPPQREQSVPVQPQLTVELPLEVAQPIKESTHRDSNAVVEEEPTPLQRNGSGRRSWTVKTYENNIRFDNQKLKMPDVDYVTSNGHITNGVEKMNGEENAVLRDWDPRPLVGALYEVSYNPRLETKRNRFVNMEGHVDVPSDETNTLAELEREWKQQYMRTKEGRLQVFVSHCAEEAPAEDIVLSGCEVDANRDERTLTIHGGPDHIRMLLRVPSSVFDKWRQALLSHAASSQIDAYVKPVHRTMEHLTERVVIIEIGSCSIRGGRLTQEPSLPQSFFPAIAIRTDDGKIIVGEDAFAPQVRHRGEFVRPIQASDPAVERYTMDKDVVKACMTKVVSDLQVDPSKYKVLLSIPQNIPIVLISELVTIALQDIKFQGAAITRQPSLILYAYDVTTGVVVDIGDRLNIVPVIDGYVVDSAICSIPYGATQVRESLRSDLCAHNKGLYSFQSPIEKLILRYAMEQSCYVPEDYGKEEKSGVKDVMVTLEPFNPTPGMQSKFNIDSSRFTCTEGLFRPKKWGLDTKGLHQLVHEAVQMSPIDSRRTLYRNIYLAGGASLLPGLAEKLEQELANIVPNTIHTQVHISPWRYNAAYLGAQVVASSSTFEDKCVTAENLQKFLFNLSTSTF